MTYSGMPFGMWMMFAGSFQKQLTAVFGYDTDTAKAIAKKAKPKYKAIISDLPEFEKADRFKMNIVNCAMIGAFVLSMPERPDVERLTVYYADAMMTMESRLSLTSGLLSMVSSLASDSSFVRYFFSSRDRSKRKYRRMITLVSLRRDKSDTACCAWLSFRQQTHASINKNIFRRNSIGPVSIKFLKNSNPSLPLSFSSALFSFL